MRDDDTHKKSQSLWRRCLNVLLMVAMVFALSLPHSQRAEACPFCPCACLPGCDLCCGCSIAIEVAMMEGAFRVLFNQFMRGRIGSLWGISIGFLVGFGEEDPIQYDNPGDDDTTTWEGLNNPPNTADDPPQFDDNDNTDGPGGEVDTTMLAMLQHLYIHTFFKGDPLAVVDLLPSPIDGLLRPVFNTVFSGLGAIPALGPVISSIRRYGLLPAMQDMSEELMEVQAMHLMATGLFMDADIQLDTQRVFQELNAEVYQRYQPAVEMCMMGTSTKSIASAERNSAMTVLQMSSRSLDRELGNINSSAADGSAQDRTDRLQSFVTTYCDPVENNPGYQTSGVEPQTGLDMICDPAVPNEGLDRDIDYVSTMLSPLTLDVDFSDPAATTMDKETVIMMSNYLYAHDVFDPIPESIMNNEESTDEYMDLRSVVAKRSVAQASFQALSGLKSQGRPADPAIPSQGSPLTRQHMEFLLEELGYNSDQAERLLGDRPSYFAQMKVLAKMIYQRPQFYVGLNSSPENVQRQATAMEAVKSMLNRDIMESRIRSEAIMAVLLEMKVRDVQTDVQNTVRQLRTY